MNVHRRQSDPAAGRFSRFRRNLVHMLVLSTAVSFVLDAQILERNIGVPENPTFESSAKAGIPKADYSTEQDFFADTPVFIEWGLSGGLVSAGHASHKPPKTARKELDRGIRDFRASRYAEAMTHCLRAADLDVEYTEAHACVASLYLLRGNAAGALEQLERALAMEPGAAALHYDRASALLLLERPLEAEQSARRAVELAPSSLLAHYVLGLALWQQGRATQETADHLAIAATRYENARVGLAWVQQRLQDLHRQSQPLPDRRDTNR